VADPVEAIPQEAGIYPIYGVIDLMSGLRALYIDLAPENLDKTKSDRPFSLDLPFGGVPLSFLWGLQQLHAVDLKSS
jgi:hypothetical protein